MTASMLLLLTSTPEILKERYLCGSFATSSFPSLAAFDIMTAELGLVLGVLVHGGAGKPGLDRVEDLGDAVGAVTITLPASPASLRAWMAPMAISSFADQMPSTSGWATSIALVAL